MKIAGRAGFGAMLAFCLALPVLASCAAMPTSTARPTATVTNTATAAPKVTVPDILRVDASPGSLAVPAVVAPVRIRLDRLGIDMRVTAEGLDARGAMALPANAAEAGWYRYSPGLAAQKGATVIAAHIDSRHDGIGPFSRLKNATAGDTITVYGSDGSEVAYTVTQLRQVGKIDAPMADVFDTSGAPRLSVVTCGGAFNSQTGHYLDNVIVTATAVAVTSTGN